MTDVDMQDTDEVEPSPCKHYCSSDCGNEYEFVVVSASDSTTQFLCIPCFVGNAALMVAAITEPEDPMVKEAVEAYDVDTVQAAGKRGRKKGFINGMDTSGESDIFDDFQPDVTEL